MKNVLKIIAIVMISILVVGLSVGLFVNNNNSDGSVRTVYRGSNKTYTQLYGHQFNVVLTQQELSYLNSDVYVVITFNVISNNATAYAKLADLEDDACIVSAFGTVSDDSSHFIDVRSVSKGNIIFYHSLPSDGNIFSEIVLNMSDYELQDIVTPF